jgi:hypothetical protein
VVARATVALKKSRQDADLKSQLAAKDAEVTKLRRIFEPQLRQPDQKANRKSSATKKSAGAAP